MSCPPGATWTPRLTPKFLCQNLGQAGPCTLAGGCSKRRQISAAGCIICNLYRALKGIQWSNCEALKLKWGWDLESTLEPVVWREAWGSNSSVLISREPNINVFWYFYSSSPGVYTRVGFLFSFFFFFVVFSHSEASSKCNFGREVLLQCLGHHHLPQVWLLDRGTAPCLSPHWWQLPHPAGTSAQSGSGCAARDWRARGAVPIAAASGLLSGMALSPQALHFHSSPLA